MFRPLFAAALLAAACQGYAEAAIFGQFSTDTTAVAGGMADVASDAGPEGAVPLVTSSSVFDAANFASASGVASLGLFNSYAEVTGTNAFASGVGSVAYSAVISGVSGVLLHFEFTSLVGAGAGSDALTSLIVQVSSGSNTLFNQVLTSSGTFDYAVNLPGASSLTFQLVSEASTLTGGSAFASGGLAYAVTAVPEPATALLAAGGICLMLLRARFPAIRRREESVGKSSISVSTLP